MDSTALQGRLKSSCHETTGNKNVAPLRLVLETQRFLTTPAPCFVDCGILLVFVVRGFGLWLLAQSAAPAPLFFSQLLSTHAESTSALACDTSESPSWRDYGFGKVQPTRIDYHVVTGVAGVSSLRLNIQVGMLDPTPMLKFETGSETMPVA